MAGTGNTSVRSYNFYAEGTIQAGGYAANEHVFNDIDSGVNFTSKVVQIINDGAAAIDFRWSPDPGTGAKHGSVAANEPLTQDFRREKRIYLTGTPGTAFRLFAY